MKKLSILIPLLMEVFAVSRAFPAQPSGMVVGWGNINFGEYGMVSGFQSNGVVAISNHIITNAVAISAGGLFSLAVLENADVVGWGFGQPNNLPLRKGMRNGPFILGTNGPVIFNGLPVTGVTKVAAGHSHGLALLKDGNVLTWGGTPDVKGNIGPEVLAPKGLRNIKAIAAGDYRSLTLTDEGIVQVWGRGNPAPVGLTNVIAISAGVGGAGREDAALKRDGTVVTWNVRGIPGQQARQPEGMSNIVAVTAGGAHILALQDNGTVWGWGYNRHGQATGEPTSEENQDAAGIVRIDGKILDKVSAVAAGVGCSLALRKDGTLLFWGADPYNRIKPPPNLNGVVAIALSESRGLAITTNKALAEQRDVYER